MKNTARKNKKKPLNLTSRILILTFILVAVAVITPVAFASKDNSRDVRFRGMITMFDPFAIRTYNITGTSFSRIVSSNSSSTNTLRINSLMNRPQVLISVRPEIRSVFKPQLS